MSIKKDNGFITDIKVNNKGVIDSAYTRWKRIIDRCYNTKHTSYKWYGAKGVRICEEWKLFSNFKKWYDENYIEGCVIDKDIKGNGLLYSPENCVFISVKENISESASRRNYSYMKGDLNIASKNKKHYETNAIERANFKRICKRRGWVFEEFEEVFSGKKRGGHKMYYYKNIEVGDIL